MTSDPEFDPVLRLTEVQDATERFLRTVEPLDAAAVAAPSLLPGWSRGHVCAHVAGNADSLVNLLTSARTGRVIPQYPSDEARNSAIEEGAGRSPDDQLTAVRAAAERFANAVREVPATAWSTIVEWRSGVRRPARAVLWARLRELEIHHVDLGLAYAPAHWSPAFVRHTLANVTEGYRALDAPPDFDLVVSDSQQRCQLGAERAKVVVSGPGPALLAWVIGRSAGDGLTVDGADRLPVPPPWL